MVIELFLGDLFAKNGAYKLAYRIPIQESDKQPILSNTAVCNLIALTFRFDGYGDHDVTIKNWFEFQNLFGVFDTGALKYKLGPDAMRLPRLLSTVS
jgi:hypothetical protein